MLATGNLLYADGDSVTEITPEQKVVFQYKSADPRGGGTYACQRLANGNIVIGCYQAYQDGRGCGLVEITPDKKAATAGTMMAVQKLTAEGKVLPGHPTLAAVNNCPCRS